MKKVVTFILSLCLVLALLIPGLADEVSPEAKDSFTPPTVVPAKGIEDFIGEWQFYWIIRDDGTEMNREQMLADGLVDSRAEVTITESELILYTDFEEHLNSIKHEFIPEDGSLKILNGSDEPPVFRLNDNGMLSCLVPPISSTSSVGMTCYFVRVTPQP